MSSRIGYTRRQGAHFSPLPSAVILTGVLSSGQTSRASSHWEGHMVLLSVRASGFLARPPPACQSRYARRTLRDVDHRSGPRPPPAGLAYTRRVSGPRILFIRLGAIGDVVRTLPALNLVRRRHPDAYLAWLVEERSLLVL